LALARSRGIAVPATLTVTLPGAGGALDSGKLQLTMPPVIVRSAATSSLVVTAW